MAWLGLLMGFAMLLLGAAMRQSMGSACHPASMFSLVWGIVLCLISLAGGLGYFAVQPAALTLYSAGTLVFVIGAVIGDGLAHRLQERAPRPPPIHRLAFRQLVLVCGVAHLLLLPLWWTEVTAIANESSDVLVIAFQLRVKAVSEGTTVGSLVGNYLVAGLVIVPLLVYGVIAGRLSGWLAALVSIPWIVTNLMTNGRAALVQLLLVLLYLTVMVRGAIGWRPVLGIGLLFALVFGGGAVLVGKSDVDVGGGSVAILTAVVENFLDYLLQGPVLFSQYFDRPYLISPTWDALTFPCQVLERFGLCKTGPLHQDYLDIGLHGREGNVYSVYLSIYPQYGIFGALTLLSFYGAWSSFHHQRAALSKSLVHMLLAAYLFSAIPLSVFSDLFAPNIYFLIRLTILVALLELLFEHPQAPEKPRPAEVVGTSSPRY